MFSFSFSVCSFELLEWWRRVFAIVVWLQITSFVLWVGATVYSLVSLRSQKECVFTRLKDWLTSNIGGLCKVFYGLSLSWLLNFFEIIGHSFLGMCVTYFKRFVRFYFQVFFYRFCCLVVIFFPFWFGFLVFLYFDYFGSFWK